jgi:TPR repeat protein
MWQQLVHLCWKPQKRHRPTSSDVVNALRQVFRRSAKFELGVPKLHVHTTHETFDAPEKASIYFDRAYNSKKCKQHVDAFAHFQIAANLGRVDAYGQLGMLALKGRHCAEAPPLTSSTSSTGSACDSNSDSDSDYGGGGGASPARGISRSSSSEQARTEANKATVFSLCNFGASVDDSYCQFLSAEMIRYGDGTAKVGAKATQLYARAAKQGHPKALSRMSSMGN